MMATEFSQAFDAWMLREGDELLDEATSVGSPKQRLIVGHLMNVVWLSAGCAADQLRLDKMKVQETKL